MIKSRPKRSPGIPRGTHGVLAYLTHFMKLNWNLITKGMRAHLQLKNKLADKIKKLETHLDHFPPDATHLQINLEKNPKRELFVAGLTLHLPSNTLHAEKSGADPVPALDQAIKALLREIAGLKSALRHESDWPRVSRQLRGRAQASV